MLRRNTTIIVGAGASVDFSLPTGPRLLQDILDHLSARGTSTFPGSDELNTTLQIAAERANVPWDQAYSASRKLQTLLQGRPVSIDNVIHTHSEDKNIALVAKIAIALIILHKERKSNLAPSQTIGLRSAYGGHGSWLHYFLVRHFTGYTVENRRDSLKLLRFIVFNYDRCVEQLTRQVYANSFFLDDHTAIQELKDLQVVHPYGSLGILPDVGMGGEDGFGQKVTSHRICEMSQRIRTFAEGAENDVLSEKIRDAILWPTTLVFVGFGYLALNRAILRDVRLKDRKRMVLGSAFKMKRESAAQLKIEIAREFNSETAHGFDITQDALSFTEEYESYLFR